MTERIVVFLATPFIMLLIWLGFLFGVIFSAFKQGFQNGVRWFK